MTDLNKSYAEFFDQLDAEKTSAFRSGTAVGVSVDAERAAASKRVAGYLGVPQPAVEALPEEFQRDAKIKKIDEDTRGHAVLRRAYSNADFAALANDDSGPLSQVMLGVKDLFSKKEKPRNIPGVMRSVEFGKLVKDEMRRNPALDPETARRLAASVTTVDNQVDLIGNVRGADPTVAAVASGVAESVTSSRARLDAQLGVLSADMLGVDNTLYINRLRGLDTRRAAATPEFETTTGDALYGGLISTVQNAPGIVASALTGSPVPGVAFASAGASVPAYSKYRGRGGSKGEATAGALLEGVVEGGTELLPMGILAKAFGRTGGDAFTAVLRSQLHEQWTEQIATAAQDAIDTAIANPNKSWGEYWRERPDAAYRTVLATLVQSGVIQTAHTAMSKAANLQYDAEQRVLADEGLTQLFAIATGSKLRERDADSFAQLVQQAADEEGGTPSSLYVDASKLAEVLEQSGVTLEQFAQMSPTAAAALREGAASNGTVEIPTGDLVGRMTGTGVEKVLLQHLRLTEDGLSRDEAAMVTEQAQQLLEQKLQQITAQAADTAAVEMDTATVQQAIAADLKAANRFTADVNEAYARLTAAMFSVMGNRLGKTAVEVYDRYKLRVARTRGADAVAQREDINAQLEARINKDFAAAEAEYNAQPHAGGGRVLNTDIARELSPEYRADRTRAAEVHPAATEFVKKLYAKRLAEPTPAGLRNTVLFTAGGAGSGKSTGLGLLDGEARLAELTYDTTLSSLQSSDEKIRAALNAGREVAILYVYRDPIEALVKGTLPRAMRTGRTVPLSEHARNHAGAAEVVRILRDKYASDPRVQITVVDNSNGQGRAAVATLDSLPNVEYNGLEGKLYEAAQKELAAGRISQAVFDGTTGRSQGLGGQDGSAVQGQPEQTREQQAEVDSRSQRKLRQAMDLALMGKGTPPEATPADFSKANLPSILNKQGWVVLTAENPNNQPATPEYNAEAMARLRAELAGMPGVQVIEGYGMYGDGYEAPSIVATGINEQQAKTLAVAYGQESVLTSRGFVFQDGSLYPTTGKINVFDEHPGDYYTRIPDGEGGWTYFSIDINFDEKLQGEPAVNFAQQPKTHSPRVAKLLRSLTPAEQKKITDRVADKVVAVMSQLPSAREMAAIAHAGRAKRGWYKNSADALVNIFGYDAPRFAALLAAMSPQTSVENNLHNALRTWRTWVAEGRPVERHKIIDIMGRSAPGNKLTDSVLPAWINNSVAALTAETGLVLSGPKVNSFYLNLVGVTEEVTNDAWMANYALVDQTIFKGGLNAAGTDPGKGTGYLAMNARVREAAATLTKLTGETWTPAEVQETIWSWAKAVYEKADAAGESRTARQLVEDGDISAELINSVPDFSGLFYNEPFATVLREAGYGEQLDRLSDTIQDIGQPAEQGTGPAGEAAPFDAETQRRYELQAARRLERLREQRGDARAARAEQQLEEATDFEQSAPGTDAFKKWFGDSKVVDADGKPLVVYHVSTYGDFSVFEKSEQRKGMAGFGFYFTDAEGSSIYADHANEFKMNRSWRGEEKKVNIMPTYLAMQKPLVVDNIAEVQARYGKADPGGFGAGREIAGLSADAKTAIQRAGFDGVITNEYVAKQRDGSLKVVEPTAKGAIKHPVYVVFESNQIKSAIGNDGTFDNNDPSILSQGPRGAVSVVGTHFSTRVLNSTDGRFYGTGLKGLERDRLATAADSRLKARTYFYVDEGNGVRPEAGVGSYAHQAQLSNLYDAKADPLRLWRGDINDIESRILDAGFDGYYIRDAFNKQGAAVVIGPASRALAVEPIDNPTTGAPAGVPVDTTYRYGLSSKELQAIDMEAIVEAAPSARLRNGTLIVATAEIDAARAAAAEQGVVLPGKDFEQSAPGTDAFKKWFGDSKVVDADGKPLVVYHGTQADITAFAPQHSGKGSTMFGDYDVERHGIFAAEDVGLAEEFANQGERPTKQNVMPLYMSIQNPFDMTKGYTDAIFNTVEAWANAKDLNGYRIARNLGDKWGDWMLFDEDGGNDPAFLIGMLKDLGYDGARIYEQSQGDVQNTAAWVAFDSGQIKSAIGNDGTFDNNDPSILSQGPRGTFAPSTLTISLLENADLSTYLHELGHFYLTMLSDVASQPGAPNDVVNDIGTVLKWFGVKDLAAWNAMPLEQQRAHHEKFAEGFEEYLFSGKAPSNELQPLFRRFAAWMKNVYRSLSAFLNGKQSALSDEVREVFDRALATEAQIAEAEERAGLGADPEATAAAIEKLQARSLRDMKWTTNAHARAVKRFGADAKEKRQAVMAEVRDEVRREGVFAVQRWLKTGVLPDGEQTVGAKLSTPALREMYGEGPAAPWRYLATNMVAAEEGLHPDVVAEMFGFESGDAMVRAIVAAFPESSEVEGRTDQRMLERYGDMATPEGIRRAADEAVHNTARARAVATELKALSEGMDGRTDTGRVDKNGRKITVNTMLHAAKRFAENVVGRKRVRDLKPSLFSAAEARAAKAATKASSAGKTDEAIRAKQDQLLNFHAAKEASAALDEVERALKYLDRVADSDTLAVDYKDQIDTILDRFDLRRSTTLKDIDKRKSLVEWVEEQRERGLEPDIPAGVMNEAYRRSYKDLTVDEFRGLVDTVRQIEHFGRLKEKLLTAKAEREFAKARDRVVASVRDNADGRVADTRTPNTLTGQALVQVKRFWSAHIKAAMLARTMDGGQDGGDVWEFLIRPANEAGTNEITMREKATKDLAALLAPVLKAGKLGGKGTAFPSIGRSLNREAVLAIALNTGNDSNLQRLLGGESWNVEQLRPVLESLTAADWQFVQAVWDYFESYRPMIAEKERRVSGREPEWIAAAPRVVTTADGKTVNLRGGYYPVKYDPRASERAEAHMEAEEGRQMMRGAYTSSTTRRSFTKARAEEVHGRPLLYSLDGIYNGLQEVIHDLAWHEYLIDATSLVRDKGIASAMRETYGPEAHQQFKSWLQDIAQGDVGVRNAGEAALGWVRQGVSIAGLGYNVMTALIQPFGLTQSIVRVGSRYIGKGMAEFIGSPIKTIDMVHEKSDFMRTRPMTRLRELAEVRAQVKGRSKTRQVIDGGAFYLMLRTQQMVDIPTWVGMYEKAIAEGNEEQRARDLADQAVIDAQGSGTLKDQSAIERGGQAQRLFTVFYSFFNTTLNLGVSQTATRKNKAKLAADYLMLAVIPVILAELVKNAVTPGDSGDDDPEKLIKKLAAAEVGFVLNMMFGVRELAGAVQTLAGVNQYGADYAGPAGLRPLTDLYKLAKQANQGEADDAFRKALVNTAGELLRLPAAQVNRSITGAQALADGKTNNPAALLLGYQEPK